VRIHLGAVGRLKTGPEADLVELYCGRARDLGRQVGITSVSITEHAESQAATAHLRRTDESARLVAALPARTASIALDERGKDLTSASFADEIRRHIDAGTADLALLIGGPDGHGDAVLKGAFRMIALGRMTWPHRLARVLVAEQVYRAVTILLNHPYHRA
jgi:23S rRNA (pseudouridine1915-N3)-methyltransferase